jgi:hypothetical protein
MSQELRIEQIRDEHIEPHVRLSRTEYGDTAAVSQTAHLHWKFIQNPQGPSVGIHLYNDGELVGRIVALTRLFLHRGKIYKAAHIVDFLIHPTHRGMASLGSLVEGLKKLSGFDFLLITAPNPAGAIVWKALLKMQGKFDLDVAVAPIRPASLLQSAGKLRSGIFGAIFDWPWQRMVGAATSLGAGLNHVQIQSEWPEKAELDQMLSGDWEDRVVGLRSEAFLEWRYRRSPVFQYEVFFLRESGELIGYFVTRRHDYDGMDCSFILDAFGRPELTTAPWRGASYAGVSRASKDGAELAMIFGNTEWGPLSGMNALPFLRVPSRFLPRKATIFAEWITAPGFEVRRDNFYVTLGDCDMV